jgi:integrase
MSPSSRKDSKGRVLRTGECQRKDGTYEYRYKEPETNKRRSVYAPTLKELREKETQISREIERGVRYHEGNITVAELMKRTLELKKNLRKSTQYHYTTALATFSKYSLANMKIREVKATDCKNFVVQMQEDGYAYGTINTIVAMCKEAFNAAVDDDLIFKSPWKFKLRNVIKDETVKKKGLTTEETKNLIELLYTDVVSMRYKDVVLFLLETGMRIGEFCGLTVADFDFDNRQVVIERQLVRDEHGNMYIAPPKTEAGNRTIWLTDLAIESAKSIIACRNPSNVKELSVDGISGFLTLTPEGSPKCPYLYVQAFRKMKNRYVKRFGTNIVLTPHILRHTFATRASEAELTIKSLVYAMGHTTAQMSLDRYADNSSEHTSKEMQQKFSSGLTAVS